MRTIQVPYFDEVYTKTKTRYKFAGYKTVKIKNKPTHSDTMKVMKILPGICAGYCPIERIFKDGFLSAQSFYDARQRTGFLKNYFVTLIK